jgi:hypothetical protein
MCAKPTTDNDDPIRLIPRTDKAAPTRAILLKEIELATVEESYTERVLPTFTNPNTDMPDPKRAKLRIDKADPSMR